MFLASEVSTAPQEPTPPLIPLPPGNLSQSAKRTMRETEHTSPSRVGFNNEWSHNSIHPRSVAWCSVNRGATLAFSPRRVFCLDCIPVANTDNSDLNYNDPKRKVYFIMLRDTF